MKQQKQFKPVQALTFATVMHHRSQLSQLLAQEPRMALRLDMSDVQICDSAGLAFLIDARRMCQQHQVALTVVHLSKEIVALAKLYGIEEMLK